MDYSVLCKNKVAQPFSFITWSIRWSTSIAFCQFDLVWFIGV